MRKGPMLFTKQPLRADGKRAFSTMSEDISYSKKLAYTENKAGGHRSAGFKNIRMPREDFDRKMGRGRPG